MLKRLLAVFILLIAAIVWTLLFIPFAIIWVVSGKDYITSYIKSIVNIVDHLVKY